MVSDTPRGPEQFQSHCGVSITLKHWCLLDIGSQRVFFQVLQVPQHLGCQLHASRCVWCCWEVGLWYSPYPQPTNSHLLILSFFSFFLENIPRETLMHFAVRLGLLRLTWFLLQQPGGRGALSIHNNEGATPVSLALERGYQKLYQLLTE